MLSNNALCLSTSMRSCAACVTIISNGSIIPTGFKFTELHTLILAGRSYAILLHASTHQATLIRVDLVKIDLMRGRATHRTLNV